MYIYMTIDFLLFFHLYVTFYMDGIFKIMIVCEMSIDFFV